MVSDMTETYKSDQRSPYFKLFPRDFFASSKVARMDIDTQGTYMILLMREWLDGYIPADLEDLAALIRMPLDVLQQRWKYLGPCFEPVNEQQNKLVNVRLENERSVLMKEKNAQIDGGRRGGENSANKRKIGTSNASFMQPETTLEGKVQPASSQPAGSLEPCLNHADADADADAKVTSSVTDVTSVGSHSLADACTKGNNEDQDPVDAPRRRPVKPDDFPTEWPENLLGMKRLAVEFLAAFSNVKLREAQVKHGPQYVEALSIFRSRRDVTTADAWEAFADCIEANNGKPLFGAKAKSALSFLRQKQSNTQLHEPSRNGHAPQRRPPTVSLSELAEAP